MDDEGRTLIDFVEPKAYYRHARRLSSVLQTVGQQREIKEVDAGDIVLVLPSMFTGNTDFTVTPVGALPGGFVLASIINSRLRGQWLQSFDWPLAGPAVAALLGVLIVVFVGRLALLVALLACCLWICAAMAAFAHWGVVMSLTTPVLALAVAVGYGMADRSRFAQRFQRLFLSLKAEHTELERELNEAATIARALLPAKVPTWEGLNISTFHQPLNKTSGDWFAFETSPSGRRLHYFMCDIVGHGVQAAIVASTCRSVLSMLILSDPDGLEDESFMHRYASTLNRVLHENAAGAHSTTLLALCFDRVTGKVTSVSAGHPRPVFIGVDATKPQMFGVSGNPLGLFLDNEWQLTHQQLNVGDAIVVYTDGVPLPHRQSVLGRMVAEASDGSDYSRAERLTRAAWTLDMARRIPAEKDDASLAWFKRVA